MSKKIATILNEVYSGGLSGLGGLATLFSSTFGTIWFMLNVLGITGGLKVFMIISLISFFMTSIIIFFSSLRWALIAWCIKSNLEELSKYGPQLIIGIGPGGSIVAGIISKLLAERKSEEPVVFVLDREYKWDGKNMNVSVNNTTSISQKIKKSSEKILLVTSEIHTGYTMKEVMKYLDKFNLTYKTYSFITDTDHSSFIPDYNIIESSKRGLLPWKDNPKKKYS